MFYGSCTCSAVVLYVLLPLLANRDIHSNLITAGVGRRAGARGGPPAAHRAREPGGTARGGRRSAVVSRLRRGRRRRRSVPVPRAAQRHGPAGRRRCANRRRLAARGRRPGE